MSDEIIAQAYEFILRTTADGIVIANPDGVVQRMNPAAAALLGLRTDDVIDKLASVAFRRNGALLGLFREPGDHTAEVKLPRRRLALGVATTLSSGERLVLLQDVTEQRSLESRRESLVSTMSHDLRNPISAIGGYADLVRQFGNLNDQQAHFITRIRQTVSKIYDVTGPLVDLAWIEAGMPLAHEPIKLHRIIHDTVRELDHMAGKHNITIAVSVQSPMPLVMGDATRLRMVVFHLLQNAILYSDAEQSVAIHAWGDQQEVYCSVADRGIGIAEDEIPLVFDRLYRSNSERVRETPGGGLGLTIAQTIIERHGGSIWAVSELGEGSTFTFVLPTVAL